jgi:two-component system chemotaxis sensor kinase CheA
VSFNLQRGVLDTRMMPVSPLFNRFKRVVRDLSKDRGKKVNLLIHGENTELDKRMIDELGDPLVHLVRNSLDHGMESPEVRISRGKSEIGTIVLEASHSGNNVLIHVRDDGGGIDVAKIKAKLVANQILSAAVVDELSDQQALDYIWDPGFSTAQEITDISGRGVGMDVVKTRINQLNGTIELKSIPGRGTHFTIRLPLTLAIIRSLLVRLRDVTLAMPIDDVREIVSVAEDNIITVHGKQTIDVRGEFIPLVRIDDVFQWHDIDYGYQRDDEKAQCGSANNSVEVVVLQASRRSIGLRVDELIGSQDIVIKSLSDNFLSIRGLSGASILGDGSVSLMLDVGTFIDMVTRPMLASETEEVLN